MTATTTVAAAGKEPALKEDVPAGARGIGQRHRQLLLLSLGLALGYCCRINLSICIVAMTSKEAANGYPVYEWDPKQRGLVLSSFFWGYMLMQVPGATLANRYGPARFVLLGVTGCAGLAMLTPLAASWGGWMAVCALRMAEGLCQGVIFPSVHFMIGRWSPPVERGRASPKVFTGPSIGTLVAMGGVGLLCGSPLGWPSGFYVPGVLALVWGVFWMRMSADSPAKCKRISAEERDYIIASLGDSSSNDKRLSVPWGAILTSPAMWALITVHMASNFGHWMLLTQIPTYMETMLHFNIKSNGIMSSMPYLSLVITSFLVGWVSQIVNESNRFSIAASRKLFNSLGHYGMGTMLVVLSVLTPMGVPVGVAVAVLTVVVSLEAMLLAGFLVNHVDLSPNFGGAMMGISNGLGNTMGIVAPILTSLVVNQTPESTEEELATGWSRVFLIGACVYFFGNTMFVLFGRADVQPWNNPESSATPDKAEKGEKGEKGEATESVELLAPDRADHTVA